jgi:hypothetical protein
VKEFIIPFGQERDQDLRYSSEFAHVSGEIAQTLRDLAQL